MADSTETGGGDEVKRSLSDAEKKRRNAEAQARHRAKRTEAEGGLYQRIADLEDQLAAAGRRHKEYENEILLLKLELEMKLNNLKLEFETKLNNIPPDITAAHRQIEAGREAREREARESRAIIRALGYSWKEAKARTAGRRRLPPGARVGLMVQLDKLLYGDKAEQEAARAIIIDWLKRFPYAALDIRFG